jgi:CBS domain containing-hemolysin-like protein
MPAPGDVIEETGWRLEVTSTDGRRIREVELTPVPEPRDEE